MGGLANSLGGSGLVYEGISFAAKEENSDDAASLLRRAKMKYRRPASKAKTITPAITPPTIVPTGVFDLAGEPDDGPPLVDDVPDEPDDVEDEFEPRLGRANIVCNAV